MHKNIEDVETELEKICKIKNTLIDYLDEEVCMGRNSFDLASSGQVADMIKDLSEASEKFAKELYYCTVVRAMENREDDENYSMGYNHRHLNNGRFASAGRGHIVGYRPYMHEEEYVDNYLSNPNFEHDMKTESYYDRYKAAKRNYTVSGKTTDKDDMDSNRSKYISDSMNNIKEMIDDSDPLQRTRLKEDIKKVYDSI